MQLERQLYRQSHLSGFILLTLLLAAGLVSGLTACQQRSSPERATSAQLPMWTITDHDSQITLIGSMHILHQRDLPLPQPLLQAVIDAERVVFENDPAIRDDPNLQAAIETAATYKNDQLSNHVSVDTYNRLRQATQALGISDSELQRYPAWYWYLFLPFLWGSQHGYHAHLGVDLQLMALADRHNIPTGGLEHPIDVFNQLNHIKDSDAEALLLAMLKDMKKGASSLQTMASLWRNGNLDHLQQWWNEHNPLPNENSFTDRVMHERNQHWVPQMQAALSQNQRTVFIVGIGHMLGEHSVLTLLQNAEHPEHHKLTIQQYSSP